MEFWRRNILIDEEQLEEVSSALLSVRDSYDYSRGHFSSYYLDWDRRPEQVFQECYGNILDQVAYDLHITITNHYKILGEVASIKFSSYCT